MSRRKFSEKISSTRLSIESPVSRSICLPPRCLDASDKLHGSDIVEFFDHPAFLRHRRIAFLRASFKGDLWLSTRLQFYLDPHLSPLTQPVSILLYIFYNVLRWPFRDTFRLKILYFLKLAFDIPQYAILFYGN